MRNEMNRVPFRTQTKKLFLKVGVLLCAVCLSTNLTWAGNYGYFYAYGENYNKYDGTAKGKVYVSTSESTPSSYSMARYNSKEYTSDNDGKIDMWLYVHKGLARLHRSFRIAGDHRLI